MSKKKKGELPSGNIRRQIYDHSEPVFDSEGKPVIDPKTGKPKKKRIYKSVTAESSKEADRAKAEIIATGKKVTAPNKMSLHEAIDKYIESSDAILSPPTIRGYRNIQKSAFKSIMGTALCNLNEQRILEAVNEECKRTTGKNNPRTIKPKTVKNEFGLVSAVLSRYAPHIQLNDIALPKVVLNQHEISKPDVIFEIVRGTNIELAVLLAMWLSFTESEILGLTKSKSISSDGNYISIREVMVLNEHEKMVRKPQGKQPARNRTHRIPDYIKGLIDKVETDQLVTVSGSAIYKRFRRLVEKSGIPYMTFHDLRHVNASVMSILNVPDKYAQERGGWHSDHIMKSVYQQTFSTERAAVDDKIDAYFDEVISGNRPSEKYKCWLTLFEKEDTSDNRTAFLEFCSENQIRE